MWRCFDVYAGNLLLNFSLVWTSDKNVDKKWFHVSLSNSCLGGVNDYTSDVNISYVTRKWLYLQGDKHDLERHKQMILRALVNLLDFSLLKQNGVKWSPVLYVYYLPTSLLHGGVCHRRMWMEVIMRNLLIGIQTGHNHNYPDISHKERIRYVYVLRIVSNNYRLIAELICLLSHLYLWCGACSWLRVTWVGRRVTRINTSDQRLQSLTFILSC